MLSILVSLFGWQRIDFYTSPLIIWIQKGTTVEEFNYWVGVFISKLVISGCRARSRDSKLEREMA